MQRKQRRTFNLSFPCSCICHPPRKSYHGIIIPLPLHLLQSSPSKSWQHVACTVNIGIVVLAQLLLFLGSESSERLLHVAVGILAANHETDLARWVGGDGGVGVLNGGKDFFAVLLELGDE